MNSEIRQYLCEKYAEDCEEDLSTLNITDEDLYDFLFDEIVDEIESYTPNDGTGFATWMLVVSKIGDRYFQFEYEDDDCEIDYDYSAGVIEVTPVEIKSIRWDMKN